MAPQKLNRRGPTDTAKPTENGQVATKNCDGPPGVKERRGNEPYPDAYSASMWTRLLRTQYDWGTFALRMANSRGLNVKILISRIPIRASNTHANHHLVPSPALVIEREP